MAARLITDEMVRTVADHAGKMSGGWFGVQIGGNLGHGTRYISTSRQDVWYGAGGAGQAAAYFLGAIDALNSGEIGDLPAEVNAVREALVNGGGWLEEYASQGHGDAQSRIRYLGSRRSS